MSEQINFGITKETRSEGVKLFNPPFKLEKVEAQYPNGYKFPVGKLVNVKAEPEYETKDGKKPVIQFIFKGTKGESYTHIEWNIDATDDKFATKLEGMQSRIKHILEQTGLDLPGDGIGSKAANFVEFFADVENVFNSQTIMKDEKPIKKYYTNRLYIKVTYYKKNLGFPLFPDFLQLAEKDGKAVPCSLGINPSFDNLEPDITKGDTFNNVTGAGGKVEDLPDFD